MKYKDPFLGEIELTFIGKTGNSEIYISHQGFYYVNVNSINTHIGTWYTIPQDVANLIIAHGCNLNK